jgi:hypothetical protein
MYHDTTIQIAEQHRHELLADAAVRRNRRRARDMSRSRSRRARWLRSFAGRP